MKEWKIVLTELECVISWQEMQEVEGNFVLWDWYEVKDCGNQPFWKGKFMVFEWKLTFLRFFPIILEPHGEKFLKFSAKTRIKPINHRNVWTKTFRSTFQSKIPPIKNPFEKLHGHVNKFSNIFFFLLSH